MTTSFPLQAYNLYDSIAIKAIRSTITGRVLLSTPGELQAQYGENRYAFIYRFGALVFFNMSQDAIDAEIDNIKSSLGPAIDPITTENFQIHPGTQDHVEFDYAELKKISLQGISVIALTVGQSAAIETFEMIADQMLRETHDFMQRLARIGTVPLSSKVLLKFIGSAASTRQHIITNLAILDPPEEAWRSREVQKLFKEVQQRFDIDMRFRALDRKLTLVQDNLEILANLVSTRRATILEVLIVLLIVFELLLAILAKTGF